MSLTDLPPEILTYVFKNLGSIDDVHHLARSWRAAAKVIQQQSTYVDIMRSVISHAPANRFDVQLCKVQELHRQVVSQVQMNPMFVFTASGSSNQAQHCDEHHLLDAIVDDQETSISDALTDNRIHEVNTISVLR